jgi:hypothetical protein
MNWLAIFLVMIIAIFSTDLINSVKDQRQFDLTDDYVTAPVFGIIFITALLGGLLL